MQNPSLIHIPALPYPITTPPISPEYTLPTPQPVIPFPFPSPEYTIRDQQAQA